MSCKIGVSTVVKFKWRQILWALFGVNWEVRTRQPEREGEGGVGEGRVGSQRTKVISILVCSGKFKPNQVWTTMAISN